MAGPRITIQRPLGDSSQKLLLVLLGVLALGHHASGSTQLRTSFTAACGDFVPSYSRRPHIDLFKLQLVPYSQMTLEECGAACTSDIFCQGFLYTNGTGCSLMAELLAEGVPYSFGNSYVKCVDGEGPGAEDPLAEEAAKSTLAILAEMDAGHSENPEKKPADTKFVLPADVVSPGKCGTPFPGFSRVNGFDFWPAAHTDLDVLPQPIAMEECAFACINLPQCKGWMYKPAAGVLSSGATGCFLKNVAAELSKYEASKGASYIACSDSPKAVGSSGVAVQPKDETAEPVCGATLPGLKVYPGLNLWPLKGHPARTLLGKRLTPMVLSLCVQMCASDSGCTGFVYHTKGRGKNGCQLASAAPGGMRMKNSKEASYVKC
eukprot:TRINITY_DN4793_c0_g1_i2.p1 TRINITY_DN4793_c0_g1~~TRINITY_DN4793_c0_g1_i2.p1  ORF type:complete len:377 (+),score=57.94 TRINITY_DN4793_c0_g1_i2:864-1994(+)